MALTVTPEQLGLVLPSDKHIVYGVIMDWAMDDAIATTVAFSSGDASLYLSSGGGTIGGGQHEKVSAVAKSFVDLAQTMLTKSTKTEATPLPRQDVVNFYLLTNRGIHVGQDEMNNFQNNSSNWLNLFIEGNSVLAELTKTEERKIHICSDVRPRRRLYRGCSGMRVCNARLSVKIGVCPLSPLAQELAWRSCV